MELMVVVAVLAIIAAAVVLSLRNITHDAKESIAKSDLRTLVTAVVIYESRHQAYPPVTDWETYLQNDDPRVIDRIPADPFNSSNNQYIYKLNTDSPAGKTYVILSVGTDGIDNTTVTYDTVNKNGGDDIILSNAATVID